MFTYGSKGIITDTHTIGTHVGDESSAFTADIDTFIEPLSSHHSAPGCVAHAQGGLLLHSTGSERRDRLLLTVLLFNLRDAATVLVDLANDGAGSIAVADVELLAIPLA